MCDYNLFIPNEDDYDEGTTDSVVSRKKQLYATRLYIVLLAGKEFYLAYKHGKLR